MMPKYNNAACAGWYGLLNERFYLFKEQDALSEHCKGRIQLLPGDYNVCVYTSPAREETDV